MNELIKINYEDEERPTVSGRDLHNALDVKTPYTMWFERMKEYGFSENEDYILVSQKCETNNPKNPVTVIHDHAISIPMAKELCMLQRTEKGSFFRKYFIKVEEAWNSPEMIMKRALEIADRKVKELQVNIARLEVDNEVMRPKAEYFDELVDRNLLTNIRDTSKELKIKQNTFVDFLIKRKYLYRDRGGKLLPYSQYVESGLFEVKEFANTKTGFTSVQTLITPKGRETFRLLVV